MRNKLSVSSSPHIRSTASTQRIMLDVIIALLPTTVAGVIIFGLRSLAVIASCIASALLSEFLFNLITKRENTLGDLSAVLTGLLLALNLRADTPIWQCVIGAAFAIVVVKCLFGGLGCNFANPAITARVFMLLAFTGAVAGGAAPVIEALREPFIGTHATGATVEVVTGATPLELMKWDSALPSLLDMFLGIHGGAIGETCSLALIVGFVYLVLRRVIKFETPVIFVGTVFLLSLIAEGGDFRMALYAVLSGGLLLGAIFMATDYVTTPITRSGKMIFAFGCGLITFLIRYFGAYSEGVSYAILFMNILSPYIEKWTAHKPFGGNRA